MGETNNSGESSVSETPVPDMAMQSKGDEPAQSKDVQKKMLSKNKTTGEQASGWSTGNLLLLCLIVSVVSQLFGFVVYDRYFTQKIVAIDIKGYIGEQRNLFLQGKIDEAGLKKKFDDLETAVLAVSGRIQKVIIPKGMMRIQEGP